MKSANRKIATIFPQLPGPELEAILEITENAFVLYDQAGAIRMANSRLASIFHLNNSERDSLRDFSSFSRVLANRLPNAQGQIRPPWLLCQPGNGAGREQLELVNGEQIVERIARPVMGQSGQVSGWVERYRDCTSERELPARLLQTEKLAALGQMVAGVTHELNNPLTAIMGYGQLLLERPLDPKSHAALHRICQDAERAARIVRNLLTLAREAKLERSVVNLNEIIDRTLRLCAYELQRSGIQVKAELDPRVPEILANSVQLQQVVLNLLVNSQQAIAEAGRPGRILLRTHLDADHLFLHVEDNGPGVAPEIQSRIFEPFFTTKPVGVGTGLGLSIVTGILRQHGAEIQLARTGPDGTTFTVSLPAAQALPHQAREKAVETVRPAARRRILVVETRPGVGRLIVDALTEIGHTVEFSENEDDALERVKRGEYDLIICDWEMEDLNGPELYRAIGEAVGTPRDRLLLITSDPTLHNASAFLRENQLTCLIKPFQLSELKQTVAGLLARQAEAGAVRNQSTVEAV